MKKNNKLYRISGGRGLWCIEWTDGGAWKATSYQYKCDLDRAEKCFKQQGYKLQTETCKGNDK